MPIAKPFDVVITMMDDGEFAIGAISHQEYDLIEKDKPDFALALSFLRSGQQINCPEGLGQESQHKVLFGDEAIVVHSGDVPSWKFGEHASHRFLPVLLAFLYQLAAVHEVEELLRHFHPTTISVLENHALHRRAVVYDK